MGRVVLSLDAELAWGFHDQEHPPVRRIRNARSSWRRIVDIFKTHSIPATWAVVGHLLLEDCDGDHRDHPAAGTGWFDSDPGGDETESDRWFGRSLVDTIRSAETDHEIASHSFSHVIFDRDQIDTDVAEAEFRRCNSIARRHDLEFTSFVFPRNIVGYREQLARHGFESYRGRSPPRWYDDSSVYPVAKFASYTVGKTAPPIVYPEVDEYGLVNVPASFDLFSFEGIARQLTRPVGEEPTVRQAKMGVDAAAESDGVFHIWLHPNNLIRESDFERLDRVLSYIADQRDRGRITVETMADVTQQTLATHDN